MPEKKHYVEIAHLLLDGNVWKYIIKLAGIESLMDARARKELSSQIAYHSFPVRCDGELIDTKKVEKGLPPVTVDNIISTLEKFRSEKGHIFKLTVENPSCKTIAHPDLLWRF